MEIVLRIPFLAFNNANIEFDAKSFIWKSYSIAKALPIARQIEQTNK